MKKQRLFWFICLLLVLPLPVLLFLLLDVAQGEVISPDMVFTGPGQRYTENIPVIDIRTFGYQPVVLTAAGDTAGAAVVGQGGGSDPSNPYAVIRKTGPTFVAPGATAHYEVTLSNYESMTHTYQLTDTLPLPLTYIQDASSDLTFNPATRTLTWQGELSPGHLDYVIEENSFVLPYLDLAGFGAVNLCDDFIASGEDCNDVTVTFNLGINGYTANLYGQVLSQLTVSTNGLVLGNNTAVDGRNQWLPDPDTSGLLLAGLWRDVDLTTSGRWHVAIISGLVAGYDVFYVQWHDASHANNPDLTARHAIAILLNGSASTSSAQASTCSAQASTSSAQAVAGHAFFIYDNISDPAQLVMQGYTIGVTDKTGARGLTYAYAPCPWPADCDDTHPPQGYPPLAGTTLYLQPVLLGAGRDYHRTFSYRAIVNGQVPETITNTAVATSSSADPALASVWSTHYLYVRRQTYLPFVSAFEVAP
ncbi:MAG: hypothetical protein KJ069_23105 [Anaerolineae bacterium]|nr:hypothetical protein [Anaerolineae bacterium]